MHCGTWMATTHSSGGVPLMVLIMFLNVSNNNCGDTVLSAFTRAVEEYGLPSRIRVDCGGENICVAEYMLTHLKLSLDAMCITKE